ncbi:MULTISPECIES: hypothetical protein [Pseudomonas]|nr:MULTISPECIES: hypothetical protein [Pseudomonas]
MEAPLQGICSHSVGTGQCKKGNAWMANLTQTHSGRSDKVACNKIAK